MNQWCNMGFKEQWEKTKAEVQTKGFWKGVRCEFLGTLLYVVFGCGTTILKNHPIEADYYYSYETKTAVSFGLSESVLVQSFGHGSGGHFNPSITIAMLCVRYITLVKALTYLLVQAIGAVVGAGILYGLTPSKYHGNLGVTEPHRDVDKGQAFGFEFLGTFMVVFTYFSTLELKRDVLVPKAFTCGLAVCLSHIFTIRYTGASINPARSLGPALIMNIWTDHWVYWVGPILGGMLGGFTFEYTKDSSKQFQNFKFSLKQKVYSLQRKEECASTNSIATELACDHDITTEELQI
ncbi:aquaporin-4-like [Argopecten irradians]|uniref:aquaporin-4-like n=1 Tax=Argopecten irradians TaxID=31199 RepID=UPI003721C415